MAIRYSVFALELATSMRNERSFQRLRAIVARQPAAQSFAEKRELYQDISQALLTDLPLFGRGCWDYFLDADIAEAKYAEWCQGVTEHEGVRNDPSRGLGGPYRASGEEGFFAFTIALLVTRGSNTDATLQARCDEAQGRLWTRGTFCDFIQALPELNFASVRSDVVYLIPGNDTWALTETDLSGPKFSYLRAIEGLPRDLGATRLRPTRRDGNPACDPRCNPTTFAAPSSTSSSPRATRRARRRRSSRTTRR